MNTDRAKVMVVDDEIGTRESIRLILKDHYDVVTNENPIIALDDLSTHPVDVVISDIRMPQMNGIEVLKRIKEIQPATEVIMVTAYASFSTAQESLKHEALDYLLKPFSRRDVETAVEKALIRRAQKQTGEQSTQQVKILMKQLRDLSEENRKLSSHSEQKSRFPQSSTKPSPSELNQKAVALRIVQTISKAVLRNLDLRELLKSVIHQVHNGLGYDSTVVFLLDEREHEFEGVWKNGPSGNVQEASDQKVPLSAVPSSIEFSENEQENLQVSCPIWVDKELVGMLRIDNGLSQKRIDDVELELIGMLAEDIAIAIKNAKQYQALKEHTAELTSVNEQLQQENGERVQAQEALQESNRRLEATLKELKQTQVQVIQQERLRALGQMASGIAHGFNNALSPILGFSELLLNSPETLQDNEKTTRYLQMMNTTARDAANVVRRLREFYRYRDEDEILQLVNLKRLAEQSISLTQPRWKNQAQAAGATIHIETALQEVPLTAGNEAELREVLTNLIFNAVDAIPNGGTITLRTCPDGDQIVLEVSDAGRGMNEEVRRRCLDPFFSTKGASGTGMGLAVAYGNIRRHNGTIEIQSKVGQGTTVTLRLPVQTEGVNENSTGADLLHRKLRVLVVEDEPAVREIVSAYLTTDGHTVDTATNGREGLEKFHVGQFDLVVTDRAMPDMNGDRLASAVKQLSPNKPVMMLTGFGDLMEATGERLAAVDITVSKPVTLTGFRRALAKVIT